MPRYSLRASQAGFQIWANDYLDAANPREFQHLLKLRFAPVAVIAERLDGGIETDFVSILKGIREGFFGAINADGHAIDLMCLDAGRV